MTPRSDVTICAFLAFLQEQSKTLKSMKKFSGRGAVAGQLQRPEQAITLASRIADIVPTFVERA
jgi:hypothetical protein